VDLQEIFKQTIASRTLRKDFSKMLGKYELIYGEFEILYHLLSQASQQPSAITAFLNCQPAATSRIIKSLYQKELVEYDHDVDDRRQVYVSLSKKGQKLIETINSASASASA